MSALVPPSISAPGTQTGRIYSSDGDKIFFEGVYWHAILALCTSADLVPPDPDGPSLDQATQAREGDVMLVYHPHSERRTEVVNAAQYRAMNKAPDDTALRLPSGSPWAPFPTKLDFEVAKWMLDAGLNKPLVERGIALFKRCQAGSYTEKRKILQDIFMMEKTFSLEENFTLQSYSHLRSIWKEAAGLRTGVRSRPY